MMNSKGLTQFSHLIRKYSTPPNTNCTIKPVVVNRNPRNLERLRLERKPSGYTGDLKDVEYWHKLRFLTHTRSIEAQLVHNSNKVVVQASTNEWAIAKHLCSIKDKQAHVTLAKVFAERCLEFGLITFKTDPIDEDETTNISAFYKTLKEEGLMLEELHYYDIHAIWRRKREKRPWTVQEG